MSNTRTNHPQVSQHDYFEQYNSSINLKNIMEINYSMSFMNKNDDQDIIGAWHLLQKLNIFLNMQFRYVVEHFIVVLNCFWLCYLLRQIAMENVLEYTYKNQQPIYNNESSHSASHSGTSVTYKHIRFVPCNNNKRKLNKNKSLKEQNKWDQNKNQQS